MQTQTDLYLILSRFLIDFLRRPILGLHVVNLSRWPAAVDHWHTTTDGSVMGSGDKSGVANFLVERDYDTSG